MTREHRQLIRVLAEAAIDEFFEEQPTQEKTFMERRLGESTYVHRRAHSD